MLELTCVAPFIARAFVLVAAGVAEVLEVEAADRPLVIHDPGAWRERPLRARRRQEGHGVLQALQWAHT